MADWSQLPSDALISIAERLMPFLLDYIRFAAVCTAWRSAALESYRLFPYRLPSCRILPLPFPDDRSILGVTFLAGGTTSEVHSLDLPVDLVQQSCCGSSHGWLVMFDNRPALYLLHPFSRRRIELPRFPASVLDVGRDERGNTVYIRPGYQCPSSWFHLQRRTIRKVRLSSDPTAPGECIVLALLAGTARKRLDVGFCRVGDNAWTFQEGAFPFMDAGYHRGLFYLVDLKGTVMVCDGASPLQKVSFVRPPPNLSIRPSSTSIGKSGDRLAVRVGYDFSPEGVNVSEYKAWIAGESLDPWYKVYLLDKNGSLVEAEEGLELDERVDTGVYFEYNAVDRDLFYRIKTEDRIIEIWAVWPCSQYPVRFTPKPWYDKQQEVFVFIHLRRSLSW